MTTLTPTVVKTITATKIRNVTHYCHFIAVRQGKRSVVRCRLPVYTSFKMLTILHAAYTVDSRGACDSRRILVAMRTNYR